MSGGAARYNLGIKLNVLLELLQLLMLGSENNNRQ